MAPIFIGKTLKKSVSRSEALFWAERSFFKPGLSLYITKQIKSHEKNHKLAIMPLIAGCLSHQLSQPHNIAPLAMITQPWSMIDRCLVSLPREKNQPANATTLLAFHKQQLAAPVLYKCEVYIVALIETGKTGSPRREKGKGGTV